MLLDHDEPTNYEEAMVSPDSAKWHEAMKSEIGSMYEKAVGTWTDLSDGRQAIENKNDNTFIRAFCVLPKYAEIIGNLTGVKHPKKYKKNIRL